MLKIIWDFINTNFFSALVTIVGASFVIYLYKKQKKEQKQRAAIILVNEIRNIEESIDIFRDSLREDPNRLELPEITILSENNWQKFSDLFSKDFDQDQIRKINKFYSDAARLSYIVTNANNMFIVNVYNRASAMQQANISLISSSANIEEAKSKINTFENILFDPNISKTPYVPQGFNSKLIKYLGDTEPILLTSIGEKLKKIANLS